MSRQTDYTDETAELICDLLMDGMSLVKICDREDMPNRSTVMRWMAKDDSFATRCARARTMQADLMDDMILDTAKASTPETAAADRVKISAFQWRASKLEPKRYGDKLDIDGTMKLGADDTITGLLARIATDGARLMAATDTEGQDT